MKTPRLKADYESGEGSISGLAEWESELAGSGLTRADLLKDWIGELTGAYERAHRDAFGPVGEGSTQ